MATSGRSSKQDQNLQRDALGEVVSSSDGLGRNEIFKACMEWKFDYLLTRTYNQEDLKSHDIYENTLLHALFLNYGAEEHSCTLYSEFAEVFEKLKKLGIDLMAENRLGQNCLHCSLIPEDVLSKIMMQSEDHQFRSSLQKLLVSSNGLHAIHVFAGRYELQKLMEPLEKISEVSMHDLLHVPVSCGASKGATCLDFALKAEHKQNIWHLINMELSNTAMPSDMLSNVDHDGLTRIDHACQPVEFSKLMQSQRNALIHALRRIDPNHRALKLPDLSQAQQMLAGMPMHSQHWQKETADAHAVCDAQMKNIEADNKTRMDVSILLTAWKQDCPSLLRCALSLNLLRPDTEQKLLQLLSMQCSLPPCEMEIIDMALNCDKLRLMPDLVLTRQFDLLPTCIRLIIQLKQKRLNNGKVSLDRQDQLWHLQSKVVSIAVNALDQMFANAKDKKDKELLFKYIKGEITDGSQNPGPKFYQEVSSETEQSSYESGSAGSGDYRSVIELVEDADCSDLFATACLNELTEEQWRSSNSFGSPRALFYTNLATYIIFILYFSWYISDFERTFQLWIPDAILTAFAVLFLTLEGADLFCMTGASTGRCCFGSYFKDVFNLFHICAIVLLWLGLIWKWAIYSKRTDATAYACQAILDAAFLIWGFRSIFFLSFTRQIGPVIAVLKSLIVKDLLTFLAIILIIFFFFGVFFFNLLFPVITATSAETSATYYWWIVMLQMFTMPFDLLYANFDRINFDTPRSGLSQSVGNVANSIGLSWFRNIAVFVFLMLVNIVMLNLLMARFNRRVSTMHSKATSLWRKARFQMLRRYQRRSELIRCKAAGCHSSRVRDAKEDWWINETNYPEEYLNYLMFQATQFYKLRPLLAREVEKNRSHPAQIMAHTDNALASVHSHMEAALARLDDRMQRMEGAQQRLATTTGYDGQKPGTKKPANKKRKPSPKKPVAN